jgi:hypothetical protein
LLTPNETHQLARDGQIDGGVPEVQAVGALGESCLLHTGRLLSKVDGDVIERLAFYVEDKD